MSPKPNFLVIGAGRSGTTSIHHYLAQHPSIFVPKVKSPSFFYAIDAPDKGMLRRLETKNYFVTSREQYSELFHGSDNFTVRGEVSPAYLSSLRVPHRIRAELEDVRLIAVIRNPTDRLIARFVARRRDGLERARTLTEVVSAELESPLDLSDTAGTYVAAGFISHVLEEYTKVFEPREIRIHVYDDFRVDNRKVLNEMFRFLGVDSNVDLDTSTEHNRSKGVISQPLRRNIWIRSAAMRQLVRPLVPERIRDAAFARITRGTVPVEVTDDERSLLDEIYAEEVLALSKLLDRDLSSWTTKR